MAFVLNALVAALAFTAGGEARSLAVWALALIFLGNAANHAASLWVNGRGTDLRAGATLLRGLLTGGLGLWLLWGAIATAHAGGAAPNAWTMGMAGVMALAVATAMGMQLFAGRRGKPTPRAVWLCVRKDALVCLSVIAAGVAVALTGQDWPDGLVAALIAGLSLPAAGGTLRQGLAELRARHGSAPASGSSAGKGA